MSVKLPIYLDYAATTPVAEEVAAKMCECLTEHGVFGNPSSSTHQFGWRANELIDIAREQVGDLINAKPSEIVWTSGATEATNLALKGAAFHPLNKRKHIITSQVEHKSVIATCKFLEEQGFKVTYLAPNKLGVVEPQTVLEAVTDDTFLVSLMHVNNEIGAVTDIAAIGAITRSKNIIFHVDAAQSAGKVAIDVIAMQVDMMSFSAHKVYGPKGMGALFVTTKPKINLVPQIHGGSQQKLRSGTLATHQIVGMGAAFALAKKHFATEPQMLKQLRDRLWQGFRDIEAVEIHSDLEYGAPHILNVSFNYIEGESLIMALKDIAISTGSACSSKTLQPSYVLKALGLPDEIAHSSMRFSVGRSTSIEEIDYTINLVKAKVAQLRAMSPLWDMYKKGVDINSIEWGEH